MAPSILIVPLFAGLLFQSSRYLQSRQDLIITFGLFLLSLLGLMPGKSERKYHLSMHILYCAGFFSIMFGFYFRIRILRVISVVLALTPWRPGRWGKLCMYLWFIVMSALFLCLQYSFGAIENNFSKPYNFQKAVYAFGSGLVFFHLTINISFILFLIPIPGEHQSWKDRMKDIGEHIDNLVSTVDGTQLRLRTTAFICSLLGISLYLNVRYSWIEYWVVINILLIVFSYSLFGLPLENDVKKDSLTKSL